MKRILTSLLALAVLFAASTNATASSDFSIKDFAKSAGYWQVIGEQSESGGASDTDSTINDAGLPQTGEPLYKSLGNEALSKIDTELPVKIEVWIDQGGYRRIAVAEDETLLREFTDALIAITIGEETGEFVTDNYNGMTITFRDGSTFSISLNLKNLEINRNGEWHLYQLENFDTFWALAQQYAVDE